MSRIAVIVGERLRNRRKELGYSQEVISEMAGMHPTYIGQLERGEKNATIESVEKICIALHYPMEELFGKIVCCDEAGSVANQCYSLILSRPSAEQKQIYDFLKQLIAYKDQNNVKRPNKPTLDSFPQALSFRVLQ